MFSKDKKKKKSPETAAPPAWEPAPPSPPPPSQYVTTIPHQPVYMPVENVRPIYPTPPPPAYPTRPPVPFQALPPRTPSFKPVETKPLTPSFQPPPPSNEGKTKHDLTGFIKHDPSLENLGIGQVVVKPSKAINVLFVGRSQAGKSTIIETLKSPQEAGRSEGFSKTKDPECHQTTIIDNATGEYYMLTMIDTPGLQEVRVDNNSRGNKELLRLASTCVEQNITALNVVCFVGPVKGLHQNDIAAFTEIREFLGEEFSAVSLMILTRSDGFSVKRLDELENHIRDHPISKPMYDFCKLGTCRVGAVDMDDVEALDEGEDQTRFVIDRLRKIEESRRRLADIFIKAADKAVPIKLMEELKAQNQRALPGLMQQVR